MSSSFLASSHVDRQEASHQFGLLMPNAPQVNIPPQNYKFNQIGEQFWVTQAAGKSKGKNALRMLYKCLTNSNLDTSIPNYATALSNLDMEIQIPTGWTSMYYRALFGKINKETLLATLIEEAQR